MITLRSANDTFAFGEALAPFVGVGDVITLSGPLGAGKTSLARGILAGLGLLEEAPSPSFPVVISYELPDLRLPVWHVDLYRIERETEIYELGLADALTSGALIIEWPERLPHRRWDGALQLRLEIELNDARGLTAVVPPAWEKRWQF